MAQALQPYVDLNIVFNGRILLKSKHLPLTQWQQNNDKISASC